MTDTKELEALVAAMNLRGATAAIEYDAEALRTEGRRIVKSVTILGARRIGPHPMSPIAAAERMRGWLSCTPENVATL